MSVPIFRPRVLGLNGPKGRPAVISGTFVLAGASQPTVIGGVVMSVRRLVDGGALPFFRVKLAGDFQLSENTSSPHVGVIPDDATIPLIGQVVTDKIVANPVDARAADEIDIGVYNLAGTRIDTADNKVAFFAMVDR